MNIESKYRRKLTDLIAKVDAFATAIPAETASELLNNTPEFWALVKEVSLIKAQLQIEEDFNKQIPGHGVAQ